MFGAVDKSLPYSTITVNHPVKLMPIRRAPLAPGTYHIQGDIRDRLGQTSVRRQMAAGIFTVEFVDVPRKEKVSARTQFNTEVVGPVEPGSSEPAPKTLPGIDSSIPSQKTKKTRKRRKKTEVPETAKTDNKKLNEADTVRETNPKHETTEYRPTDSAIHKEDSTGGEADPVATSYQESFSDIFHDEVDLPLAERSTAVVADKQPAEKSAPAIVPIDKPRRRRRMPSE